MVKTFLQFDNPNKNVDETTLRTNIFMLQNGYIDEARAIHRFPGLSLFCDLGTGAKIDGLKWWNNKGVLIANSGGKTFSISDNVGTFTDITGATLLNDNRVQYAEIHDGDDNKLKLFMANGTNMIHTDAGNTVAMNSGISSNCPNKVSQIAHLRRRIICNDLDYPTFWRASDTAKPLSYADNVNYAAELTPDSINALFIQAERLNIVGQQHIENWWYTGASSGDPFSLVGDGIIDTGSINEYSIGKLGNLVCFLNNSRDVVLLDNYTPTVISGAYAKFIHNLDIVSDVEADIINSIGGRKFLILRFTSSQICLAYDFQSQVWTELKWFNSTTGQLENWRGRCYAYCINWGFHLVGDATTGKIYKMSTNYYDNAGEAMQTMIITGNYNHDTLQNKRSNSLTFYVRRGDGKTNNTDLEPKILVYVRDDFNNAWSTTPIEVNLGSVGNRFILDPCYSLNSCYKARQYKIVFSDNANLVLTGIEEDYDKV